ncbi:uncharacterized protein LOC132307910 [Cornus florida]|uniref:uncharacterized protein LOC132307910 n=1 Tax=Cornus florida TaxID=4283 RepID=UPI00289EB2E6|nr:uncharacterized protein LOC132307910 [Cornus florida]XP_059661772.1 uncharacterized protein LOC132307910 [Cornus florida]XP_059661773.1 uncharacterized protein LOC132307910 [Cornus florida]
MKRKIQETTNSPPLHEAQNGRERDGKNQPNGISESHGGTTSKLGTIFADQSLVPILHAIIKKHGDIVKDCKLKSGYIRTCVLEAICKVVQELRRMELSELDSAHLHDYCCAVEDALTMKVDVNWLRERLDEIKLAVQSNVEAMKLTDIQTMHMDLKAKRVEEIELMKKQLQNLESEIDAKECQLAVETLEVEKLNTSIRSLSSVSQRFDGKSLMDGLL